MLEGPAIYSCGLRNLFRNYILNKGNKVEENVMFVMIFLEHLEYYFNLFIVFILGAVKILY